MPFRPVQIVLLVIASCLFTCSAAVLFAQHAKHGSHAKTHLQLIAKLKHSLDARAKVHRVVFSPNGALLAAGTHGSIVIWESASGKEKTRFDCGKKVAFPDVFSPDGEQLLAHLVSPGRSIKLLEVSTGREVFSVPDAGGSMAFLPGGKQFACHFTGVIEIRDAKDGSLIRKFDGAPRFGSCILSPDGKRLAETRTDYKIRIWSLNPEKELLTLKGPGPASHFSPSGKLLACENRSEKTVTIWNTESGAPIQKIKFAVHPTRIAFSPADKYLAAAIWSKDKNQISICDVATGSEVLTLQRESGQPLALAFNPNGTQLADSSDRVVQVWELSTTRSPPIKKNK